MSMDNVFDLDEQLEERQNAFKESMKEQEKTTNKDGLKFVLIYSSFLVGLYLIFSFISVDFGWVVGEDRGNYIGRFGYCLAALLFVVGYVNDYKNKQKAKNND